MNQVVLMSYSLNSLSKQRTLVGLTCLERQGRPKNLVAVWTAAAGFLKYLSNEYLNAIDRSPFITADAQPCPIQGLAYEFTFQHSRKSVCTTFVQHPKW